MENVTNKLKSVPLFTLLALTTGYVMADSPISTTSENNLAAGLAMPQMKAQRGRLLYAEKGCVVCHSVNGIGGEHAPMLDAEFMDETMNPFEFAARMWRGAGSMVALQEEELGGQIYLTGQELADIIAFTHDAEEQKLFSDHDIPDEIKVMMHHQSEDDHHGEGEDDHG